MSISKVLNALVTSSVLCLGSTALATENCPGSHCSQISAEMNSFCIENGMAGKPYMVLGPTGGTCFCPCSCVTADTQLTSVDHGLRAINESVVGDELYSPLSPDQRGSIDKRLKSDVGNTPVIRVMFSSGATLTASMNHPLVLSDETVVAIEKLQVGDQVLAESWSPVTVRGIERVESYSGELHNVIVNGMSATAKDHLIATNGILSGDWLLQANNDAVERSIALRTGTINLFKHE